jgi:hypothetical protein
MGTIDYLENIVRESKASSDKKEVVQHLIESCRELDGKPTIEILAQQHLTTMSLIIRMFLADDITAHLNERIDKRIEEHAGECPFAEVVDTRIDERMKHQVSTPNTLLAPADRLKQMAINVAAKASWPGAAIILSVLFREDISLIVRSWAGVL